MSRAQKDKDELELLEAFEKDECQSVDNVKEQIAAYRAYARATFRKGKRINIRIAEKDLLELQKRALREGIPYQTMIASILHKYVTGLLIEKQI